MEARVFQLLIVLVVVLGRVGEAPLTATSVSQVDDGGAISFYIHVDSSHQIFSRKIKIREVRRRTKAI